MKQILGLLAPLRALAICVLIGLGSARLAADTQTFSLASQWNLISFQVVPDNPDPAAVFGTLAGFQAAWSYDASSGLWARYTQPSSSQSQRTNDVVANALLPLGPIAPGKAYWVYVGQNVASWKVSGTPPLGPVFPSLGFQPGWNMFGIPVGAASVQNREPVSLLAVLTAAGFDYDALLTWEGQSFRKMFRPPGDPNSTPPNPLAGLPSDPPFPTFDLQKDLGRGYWIRVLDPAVLRPRLVATVRPDVDADPKDNFPGKEDVNVSGAVARALPKSVADQDTIRFFENEDVQTINISNSGGGNGGPGGGILLWEAIWQPKTDTGTPEPWIRLFASPADREERDNQGALVSSYGSLGGVTTLENDIVYLRLDRRNLGRGIHEGTLLLKTSVGDRSYRVVAHVPGLGGDFKGFATVQSVNGKHNPVPDIDLFVSFYEDSKVDGLLRGVIDSSVAVLWPVDVPLVGYRVADDGNQFVLGGSFVLPPGDQNGEPFDRWDPSDPTAGDDVDWNNDHVLDNRNPFSFPIQRTVTLQGALVKANPSDGYVLEGTYNELVYGMSREPIQLVGTFHLERKAVHPLSSRTAVTQDTGVEPVVARKNSVALSIPPKAGTVSKVAVVTEMELQAVSVALNFKTPLPHSALRIKLQSPGPNGAEVVLYDGTQPSDAINPLQLASVTFPDQRPAAGDLSAFVRSVRKTKTDASTVQFWNLVVSNAGPQVVTLANWTLRLEGQPVTDVVGVVKDGDKGVGGVTVALNGLPFSQYSSLSGANGVFTLTRVPLLPLNFSAFRPGYAPLDPGQPGLSPNFTRPFVGQSNAQFTALEQRLISRFNPLAGAPPALAAVPGFSAGTTNLPFELDVRPSASGPASIVAGPSASFAGSTVEFFAVNVTSGVRWDFGDGTAGNLSADSHAYGKAGVYRVFLYSPADAPVPSATAEIVALPAPGHAPATPADLGGEPTGLDPATAARNYPGYLFVTSPTFAGVVPAVLSGTDPVTGADVYLSALNPRTEFSAGETNELGAAYVPYMPIQMAYAASMDIDLAPRVSPPGTSQPFESDGFAALDSPGFDPGINSNAMGFKNEDFNYSLVDPLWANTRALDGSPEYIRDDQNGLMVWGNTLIDPRQNYSLDTILATDGGNFVVGLDDDVFNPHPGTTTHPDLASNQVVTHYNLAISMGANLLTAPVPSGSVKPAKARRSDQDNPFDPDLVPTPRAFGRNLYYQIQTGFFAGH